MSDLIFAKLPAALREQLKGINPRSYPANDSAKHSISVAEVVSLREGRSRLPPRFANELYAAGESGMGYAVFTVVFSRCFGLLTGREVREVLPHVCREANSRYGPKYYWCIYSE